MQAIVITASIVLYLVVGVAMGITFGVILKKEYDAITFALIVLTWPFFAAIIAIGRVLR